MKIIIPMAGRGSRLRPHTLITPKPLVPIAGKPIVHRLVEDICEIYDGNVEEIAFIIGDFGDEVEKQLIEIAENLGAKGTVVTQDEPLGTAHAIWQARSAMDGEVIIAFADTLFKADFELNRERDGVIWVKTVDNPSSFGVVTLNDEGVIMGMVEKPAEFVSDMAIIGIYYIKNGPMLRDEIQYLLDNNILGKGEFQLTDALDNMRQKGAKFVPGKVNEWMDCGNKAAVLDTTQKTLQFDHAAGKNLISSDHTAENSIIIPPCHIGSGVKLKNAIIGPYASIGDHSEISNSVVQMSMIRNNATVRNVVLNNAMIGMHASVDQDASDLSLGDYSTL